MEKDTKDAGVYRLYGVEFQLSQGIYFCNELIEETTISSISVSAYSYEEAIDGFWEAYIKPVIMEENPGVRFVFLNKSILAIYRSSEILGYIMLVEAGLDEEFD